MAGGRGPLIGTLGGGLRLCGALAGRCARGETEVGAGYAESGSRRGSSFMGRSLAPALWVLSGRQTTRLVITGTGRGEGSCGIRCAGSADFRDASRVRSHLKLRVSIGAGVFLTGGVSRNAAGALTIASGRGRHCEGRMKPCLCGRGDATPFGRDTESSVCTGFRHSMAPLFRIGGGFGTDERSLSHSCPLCSNMPSAGTD